MKNKEWYCVRCAKFHSDKELYTDLGYYDNSICKDCYKKDPKGCNEELGQYN